MSNLPHGCNVLRQGNRQSFNLKVALEEVKPCDNVAGDSGGEFSSGDNSSLEHGSVYSHGSNGVHSNAKKRKLHVRCYTAMLSAKYSSSIGQTT